MTVGQASKACLGMMNEGTSDNGQPAEMPAWKLARAETGCMNGDVVKQKGPWHMEFS